MCRAVDVERDTSSLIEFSTKKELKTVSISKVFHIGYDAYTAASQLTHNTRGWEGKKVAEPFHWNTYSWQNEKGKICW